MLSRTDSPREIRKRLLNPPGGRESTELEIMSPVEVRRVEREKNAAARVVTERRAHLKRRLEARAAAKKQREQWQREEEEWATRLSARGVQVRTIILHCCEKYGIKLTDIMGQRRKASFCHVRHIIAYFSTELTARSLPEIGRILGGRDHTTILHSKNKIKGMVLDDPVFAAEIAGIRAALEAPA